MTLSIIDTRQRSSQAGIPYPPGVREPGGAREAANSGGSADSTCPGVMPAPSETLDFLAGQTPPCLPAMCLWRAQTG